MSSSATRTSIPASTSFPRRRYGSAGSITSRSVRCAPSWTTSSRTRIAFNAASGTIVAGGSPRSSSPYDLAGLELEEKTNGFLIRLQCGRKLPDYESWVKEIGEDSWLYITLANARADVAKINDIRPTGILKQVLVFQSATSVQLTFRIKGKGQLRRAASRRGERRHPGEHPHPDRGGARGEEDAVVRADARAGKGTVEARRGGDRRGARGRRSRAPSASTARGKRTSP